MYVLRVYIYSYDFIVCLTMDDVCLGRFFGLEDVPGAPAKPMEKQRCSPPKNLGF